MCLRFEDGQVLLFGILWGRVWIVEYPPVFESAEKYLAMELEDDECSTNIFVSVAMLPSLLPCDNKLSPVNLLVNGDTVSDAPLLTVIGENLSKLSLDLDLGVGYITPKTNDTKILINFISVKISSMCHELGYLNICKLRNLLCISYIKQTI